MPRTDERISSGVQDHGAWERLALWVRLNRPLAWLLGLAGGLAFFLAWLPSYVRLYFWHGIRTHSALASMTLGFSLLALSQLWSTGQRMDTWGFLFFNLRGSRPRWLDTAMNGITQIGSGVFSSALALGLYLAGYHLLAYVLALGAMTLWMMVELVKALVHRRRPFLRLSQARIVGRRAGGRSFPSGHTSQAFFMATLLARNFHAGVWAAGLLYSIALLVGITRMYVGAHYPRDVLAGAILGSAWGLLGVIAYGFAI